MHDLIGNIIVYGVSHSGTSITARLLGALGWRLDRADKTYAEDTLVRKLNEIICARQKLTPGDPLSAPVPDGHEARMREALGDLEEPWCVKDPRFPHTVQHWWPIVGMSATLLWVRRPEEDIAASFERRGQPARRGGIVGLRPLLDLAERQYEWWPGRKATLDYDRVADAVRLFDPDRGKSGPKPGEAMPR